MHNIGDPRAASVLDALYKDAMGGEEYASKNVVAPDPVAAAATPAFQGN
jgi:hypothetical protein